MTKLSCRIADVENGSQNPSTAVIGSTPKFSGGEGVKLKIFFPVLNALSDSSGTIPGLTWRSTGSDDGVDLVALLQKEGFETVEATAIKVPSEMDSCEHLLTTTTGLNAASGLKLMTRPVDPFTWTSPTRSPNSATREILQLGLPKLARRGLRRSWE